MLMLLLCGFRYVTRYDYCYAKIIVESVAEKPERERTCVLLKPVQ